LLSSYPSGLNVQNTLAARRFNCLPSQILVGNGASELIRGLLQHTRGEVGVIVPTFEEYLHRAGSDTNVRQFKPRARDFSYHVADLEQFTQGLQTLILVNPGNPTGHMLQKKELIDLIESLGRRRVNVIVDESFVDFAGEGFSLLNADFLSEHPRAVIVRSISKSYGVPGLRLGVLGSADQDLIAAVRDTMSVWNINSFAEFFLQIIGKYHDDYQKACELLRRERERFRCRLAQIRFLDLIDSDANYFLCRVGGGFTATSLARQLLDRHRILIKDCTGKAGLEGEEYVRIAVRNESENERLLAALGVLSRIGDS